VNGSYIVSVTPRTFIELCIDINNKTSRHTLKQYARVEAVYGLFMKDRVATEAGRAAEVQRALNAQTMEMQQLKGRTYYEMPKSESVYITRDNPYTNTHGIVLMPAATAVYDQTCTKAALVRKMVVTALAPYRLDSEHFDSSLEHTIDLTWFAAQCVDTMVSSLDKCTRTELCDRLVEKLTHDAFTDSAFEG
jgi:hypothetical protein